MKSTLAILALSFTAAGAFQVGQTSSRTSSALGMGGFLEGGGKRVTIRDDEDNDMWIDDKKGGRAPGGRLPSDVKKPVKKEPKAKAGGFKFPWDK